jgi:poly(hydroxyalkanoate) depolymerase family esterase
MAYQLTPRSLFMNLPNTGTLAARLQKATRLTQTGRLQEATAMIQQALQGRSNLNEVAAAPDQAQTSTPRQPFTAHAHRNINGLGDLLRGKLPGLPGLKTGLNTDLVTPADALPEGAAFNSGTFANLSGSRDYKLYIPSGYHGQRLPLVVMLHGCTQNPDDFAAGTGMNTLAESQPCLVLYPAQTGCANPSRCWNWFKPGDQQRESGEPAIIAGMTRQIIDEYKLDEQRVYVAGLSAGGAMATTLAMTYPDLYAAVGVHSGLPHGAAQDIPSALAAMQGGTSPLAGRTKRPGARVTPSTAQKIPAIIFHGDRDTTVHPGNGDRVAAQYLPSTGLGSLPKSDLDTKSRRGQVPNGHAYTCSTHHNADGLAILEQWSIHGAAHAWAGGTSQGSYTDPKGPDASREMLRFFLTHSKGVLS